MTGTQPATTARISAEAAPVLPRWTSSPIVDDDDVRVVREWNFRNTHQDGSGFTTEKYLSTSLRYLTRIFSFVFERNVVGLMSHEKYKFVRSSNLLPWLHFQ